MTNDSAAATLDKRLEALRGQPKEELVADRLPNCVAVTAPAKTKKGCAHNRDSATRPKEALWKSNPTVHRHRTSQ